MSQCVPTKYQYDFKKEYEDAKKGSQCKIEVRERSWTKPVVESQPCVEEMVRQKNMKSIFNKWETMKRVKEIYDEQVTKKRTECFRAKILQHMKRRIAEMPPEMRKAWLTKLIRLAFLRKLGEIKDIKKVRASNFVDKLEKAEGKEREEILRKLVELKDLYELKELDDVKEIAELKKMKKQFQLRKAKQLEMKIRLNRIRKLEEIKKKEEKRLREERVEKIMDVITVKKDWQEEVLKRIGTITKNLVEELVHLEDRKTWYSDLSSQVKQETDKLLQDEEERKQLAEKEEMIRREEELLNIKRDNKIKELEAWKKESNVRLWKLERVKKFQEFLESRYRSVEADENLFFRKIYNKLTARAQKKVEVDPWSMKPKLGKQQAEIANRKKIHDWIQSIVSSNKQKVVRSVKLKKYLQAMETPLLDLLMFYSKRVGSIVNNMIIIRGRILRNTFPDKTKDFIAKELSRIVAKAKQDIRDIDPTDKLITIQLTTLHNDLYVCAGDEYVFISEQVVPEPEEPCQDKTDVLCLTTQERDKMLELIEKRQYSRKVVRDTRLCEYEAYQDRMALDKAWLKYMNDAYAETMNNLSPFRRDEDVFKIDMPMERPPAKDTTSVYGSVLSVGTSGTKLTEDQIKAIISEAPATAAHAAPHAKDKVKLDFNKAMSSRVSRLVKMVTDQQPSTSKLHYNKQQLQLKDILKKEKIVRQHMIKDLPLEEDEYF